MLKLPTVFPDVLPRPPVRHTRRSLQGKAVLPIDLPLAPPSVGEGDDRGERRPVIPNESLEQLAKPTPDDSFRREPGQRDRPLFSLNLMLGKKHGSYEPVFKPKPVSVLCYWSSSLEMG